MIQNTDDIQVKLPFLLISTLLEGGLMLNYFDNLKTKMINPYFQKTATSKGSNYNIYKRI